MHMNMIWILSYAYIVMREGYGLEVRIGVMTLRASKCMLRSSLVARVHEYACMTYA